VFHKADAAKPFADPADETAQAEPEYDTPAALAEYDAETRRLTNAMAAEVDELEDRMEAAKELASDRKKAFELAEVELRQLIKDREAKRGKRPQPVLFNDPAEVPNDNEKTNVDASATGVWQGNHEFTPQELATPLSALNIAQGVLNSLGEGQKKDGSSFTPIITVGDYFEYCKPLANGWVPNLRDIKGIGDTKADAVETAILDFTAECCNAKRKAA
jgi:hypothetical protein